MNRRIEEIIEMVCYIRQMEEADKTSFRQFISKYRSSKSLIALMKRFEASDTGNPESCRKLQKLISTSNKAQYKAFQRFKKKLFEFEISSKRLVLFKRVDPRLYLYTYLKKEIIAAQILSERNAYLNAIQILHDTFRKSSKYEFVNLQLDCARNLTKFYQYTGQVKERKQWHDTVKRLKPQNEGTDRIIREFESAVCHLKCCSVHASQQVVIDLPDLDNPEATDPRNRRWIREYIEAVNLFHIQQYRHSLMSCLRLRKELDGNPGLYPQHFKLTTYSLLLENAWHLNKLSMIRRLSRKLLYLDLFPVYQKIPVLHFFQCYFLRIRDFERIDLIESDVNQGIGFSHFEKFNALTSRVGLLALFLKSQYREFTQLLNRNPELYEDGCHSTTFVLKILEVLSLMKVKETDCAIDKTENLRRNLSRRLELNSNVRCVLLLNAISDIQRGNGIETDDFSSQLLDPSPYDIFWIAAEEVVKFAKSGHSDKLSVPRLHRPYRNQEHSYSIAAER